MALAAVYSVHRTSGSPAREMCPGLSISPDWKRLGVSPKWAATVRGTPEASRVIDCRLEGERRDEAHTRCTHQALTDRILMSYLARPAVELAEGAIEHQARIEQRQKRLRQSRVGFDGGADLFIGGAMAKLRRQLDTEHLEQATHLILQIDTLAEHGFARREQGPN